MSDSLTTLSTSETAKSDRVLQFRKGLESRLINNNLWFLLPNQKFVGLARAVGKLIEDYTQNEQFANEMVINMLKVYGKIRLLRKSHVFKRQKGQMITWLRLEISIVAQTLAANFEGTAPLKLDYLEERLEQLGDCATFVIRDYVTFETIKRFVQLEAILTSENFLRHVRSTKHVKPHLVDKLNKRIRSMLIHRRPYI